jgi:hypothetical protein
MNFNLDIPHLSDSQYQVFLYCCRAGLPISFAAHPWLVLNIRSKISRWEILRRENECKTSWGHLHLNFLPPFQGIEIHPILRNSFWKGRLLGQADGDLAKRMIEFVENSPNNYPFCYRYSLTGPNSNTYVQWVLNKFPEFKVSLPGNCFGKDYQLPSSENG